MHQILNEEKQSLRSSSSLTLSPTGEGPPRPPQAELAIAPKRIDILI